MTGFKAVLTEYSRFQVYQKRVRKTGAGRWDELIKIYGHLDLWVSFVVGQKCELENEGCRFIANDSI